MRRPLTRAGGAAVASTARRWGRDLARVSRLVLAVKTAVAAAIAWILAPYVPFAESEYSYYAPLGVLVSMYPTVLDSVRSGMQALLGLALGIGLGLGALALVGAGAPAILAVALVVGAGVALGGLRAVGAGRDWIPIAGVLVLLLSGHDEGEFPVSYLVTMGFGVLVGVVVQWAAMPPLYFGEARGRLADLRTALVGCLQEVARLVEARADDGRDPAGAAAGGTGAPDGAADAPAGPPPDPEELAGSVRRALDALVATLGDVTEEIGEARRSQRANPRARRRRGERKDLDEQFRALDRAAFFVRALADLVVHAGEGGVVRHRLAEAALRCAALVSASGEAEERESAARRAREALDAYFAALDAERGLPRSEAANEVAAGTCLRRVIDALA